MTAQPAYDLPETNIVPLKPPTDPVTAVPVADAPAIDATLPPAERKKPGPKKGSKRKPRAKKTDAPPATPPVAESPAPSQPLIQRIAPASGMKNPANRVWFLLGALAALVLALSVVGAFRVLTGAW